MTTTTKTEAHYITRSCGHGKFLEWLDSEGITLAKAHEHEDGCYEKCGDGIHECLKMQCSEDKGCGGPVKVCGLYDGEFFPIFENKEQLIARHFDIDLDKYRAEKDQMLEELRRMQP